MKTNDEKEALRSALNGVIGDYLEKKENPLQIEMQFRYQSKAVPLNRQGLKETYPTINGKILLMVHGLCMNDMQMTRRGHNHGMALAQELGKTPLYLYYNSGRHISANGRDLNELLEQLVLNWAAPVEELIIVGHSMGGLLSRSALHYANQQQKTWAKYLKKIVFLGTPHHGAPLERAGNYLDVILESVPYTKPFARLGKIRSAGVTDLRHGNLLDEDWEEDRFKKQKDHREMVPPLPTQTECYSIAAVIKKEKDRLSPKVIGDGLVTVKSALGQHENPAKNLAFKPENTWVIYENTHLDLLNNAKVYNKIKTWLT